MSSIPFAPRPGAPGVVPALPGTRTATGTRTAIRHRPLLRKYEVMHLAENGDLESFSRLAPAHPAFEDAFAAFARGTLFETARGRIAIEDLLPGDQVRTLESGFQPVLWRGATTLVADAPGQSRQMGRLTRIAADALGIARPMPDLVLGPTARLFDAGRAAQKLSHGAGAFVPARDHIDGINVIELTPISAVEVFHIGLPQQHRILAHGVELESQHPGSLHMLGLRGEVLRLYLSFFPHIPDFSALPPLRHPRLRLSDMEIAGIGVA